MSDLNEAKRVLSEGGYTCAFVKGDEKAVSSERGIRPLLEFIESGQSYKGFSCADRVVGKAAALLYAHMGIAALFAEVVSRSATEVLEKFRISLEYETIVPLIINRKGDGICPMEQAVADIDDPIIAAFELKNAVRRLSESAKPQR